MAEGIGKSAMVAAYQVDVTGINRTERELARLDAAIASLRGTSFSARGSATASVNAGGKGVFVTKLEPLKGRIQGVVSRAMIEGMDRGVEYQRFVLSRAVTPYGAKRFARGRGNGPGRDDTGALIDGISRGVEVQKGTGDSSYTGYHGWKTTRARYFQIQEKGGGRVGAANSLGASIIPVREFLKQQLMGLKA